MSVLELEQEGVDRDGVPPMIGHLSDDPAKRVALCGSPILGVSAVTPFVRCVVCFNLRYGGS